MRNTHKDKVPEEWIRKQTLVSAERYITQELKEYEETNNPVLLFVQNNEIENHVVSDVYLKYSVWCRENGLSPVSNINFGRILSSKNLFKSAMKKIEGKSVRIYLKA